MAKWIAAEKVRARLRHAVVCPNVTGRTKKRIIIAQSKRARAGSLTIVDQPQVARTCILRAFGLPMSCCLSLALRLFLFCRFISFSSVLVSLKPRPLVQSFFDVHATRRPHSVTEQISASFFVFVSVSLEMSPFFRVFLYHDSFLLYGEYVVRFFLPDGVFLPCDHGLDI